MYAFMEKLHEAEKNLKVVDHIVYVTFPLIKDKRLLIKVVKELKDIFSCCINAILQYEYLYKRIRISHDSKENFNIFMQKSAPRYGITQEEIRGIRELFDFIERQKASPLEFMRGEKLIVLSENMKTTTLDLEKVKRFLILAKEILKKSKKGMGI